MPFFTRGQNAGDHGFLPHELIREEPWGEIWRAVWLKENRRVILVAFTTQEGDELFGEAAQHLRRWQEVAGKACPHLLKIFEINEGAIPFLLIEDPGGPTLREHVTALEADMPLDQQGKFGLHIATAIVEGEAYDCGPIGVTPDTIIQAPEDRDYPWRVIPVGPRTRAMCALLGAGRYFPPGCAQNPAFFTIHVDCYALAWIWTEVFRRNFEMPWLEPKKAIPYTGLSYVLESSLVDKNGVYSDPQVVAAGVDRWVSKTLKQDIAEQKEKEVRRKRGPLGNFFHDNKFALGVCAGLVVFLAVLGGGIYLLLESRTFGRPLTKLRPEDVTEMFETALLANKPDDGVALTMSAPDATREIFIAVDRLEKAGILPDKPKTSRTVDGSGEGRTADITLKNADGEIVAVASLMLQQRANAEWQISNAFLKQYKFAP